MADREFRTGEREPVSQTKTVISVRHSRPNSTEPELGLPGHSNRVSEQTSRLPPVSLGQAPPLCTVHSPDLSEQVQRGDKLEEGGCVQMI
jgi:hypothetical protein